LKYLSGNIHLTFVVGAGRCAETSLGGPRENSPAIYGWVYGFGSVASPARDERNVLPSLTGLGRRWAVLPSHEWLGYFHGNVAIGTRVLHG